MVNRRTIALACGVAALTVFVVAGLRTKVEVQYRRAGPVDALAARALAEEGYEYVALSRTLLAVAPAKVPSAPAAVGGERHATAIIDERPWTAIALPTADGAHAFHVRGRVGRWGATVLAIGRYPDSDRVSSIGTRVDDFVPKRIEQVASIATTVMQVAATAVGTGDQALQPFRLELPVRSMGTRQPLQPGWAYRVEYLDGDEPAGTISIDRDFDAVFLREDGVGYWPVPACRTAVLTLSHDRADYAFRLTVAAPDRVRLQPLPASGRVDLGSTCGASVSGAASLDPVAAVVDDTAAVQRATQSLKAVAASASRPASGAAR